jgi:hypothetical protein
MIHVIGDIKMKKYLTLFISVVCAVLFIFPLAGAEFKGDVIDRIKLSGDDIPQGFTYGNLPPFARKVLKENPWKMDRGAIKTLAPKIYPGGDGSKISAMYVAILARTERPFGDDMVCYIIIYNDTRTAADEIKKLSDFVRYNNDRAIVLSRENMAVFLHVDDITNFPLLGAMASRIEARLDGN